MLAEWIVAAAGLALTVVVCVLLLFWRAPRRKPRAAAQVRRVRVSGSYHPSEVHVSAGAPSRLIFRREETATCSERVVFPDFGLNVTLPAFEDIAVDLPASDPGEHQFTCEMHLLHGTLVVDGAGQGNPRQVHTREVT